MTMMMTYDLTTYHEREIESMSKERLQDELNRFDKSRVQSANCDGDMYRRAEIGKNVIYLDV